jgi:hypothetical protein
LVASRSSGGIRPPASGPAGTSEEGIADGVDITKIVQFLVCCPCQVMRWHKCIVLED